SRLLNIKSIVIEEIFFHVRPILFRFGHLSGNVVGRTLAPRVTASGLRPQTKRALGWTSARSVKRNIGMQKERHVIAAYIEITVINIGDVRQRVEILKLRPVGIVRN